MPFYRNGGLVFGLIEAIISGIIFLAVIIPIMTTLTGGNSNGTGKIESMSGDRVLVSWEDKLGSHTENFDSSQLGEDSGIAKEGDKVKLHIEYYGLLQQTFSMIDKMESGGKPDKEKVEVTGLKIWFWQRWAR